MVALRRVVIAGGDSLALAGIERLLNDERVRVVGLISLPAVEGRDAWDFEEPPDALLWDAGKRDEEGVVPLAALQELLTLALVVDEAGARDALAAGARGVLLRDREREQILGAIDAVASGLFVLDEDLAPALLRPPPVALPSREALTPREHDVLELLALGHTNREIADRLGVSPHTAKFHVNSLLGKLGATSRTEAVGIAVRAGLVTL